MMNQLRLKRRHNQRYPNPGLPRAVRWLLADIRKDDVAFAKLAGWVEWFMQDAVEQITDPYIPVVTASKKKGRKKEPVATHSPGLVARSVHDIAAEELVALVTALGPGQSDIDAIISDLDCESFEEHVIDAINSSHQPSAGPWACSLGARKGELIARFKFTGSDQDKDTELPLREDIDTPHIERTMKSDLGAVSASFRWSLYPHSA